MKDSMIGRRACLVGAGAALLQCSAGAAVAAGPAKVYRIGVLDPDPAVWKENWDEFVAELARRGYTEGRNLVFEKRFGEEVKPELANALAAELVALKPDLIYAAHGSMSALAARNATRTIPVVFFSSADPVGLGLVASLSKPGGNVTGNSISSFDTIPKSLQFLAEAMGRPNIRVVDISARGTSSLPWYPKLALAVAAAARQLGAQYRYEEVGSMAELDVLFKRLVRDGIDAVNMSTGPLFKPHLPQIVATLIEHRLPSIGDAAQGFLLNYDTDFLHVARKAAGYVDKILRGARPSELPVEQVSTFELVINLKTAAAMGLTVPRSLLLRADRLIR